MKKLFPLVILLLSIMACNQTEKNKETKIIIQVENSDSDFLVLKNRKGFSDTIHQTTVGLFEYKFDSLIDSNRFYITKNRKSLTIYIDNYETVELVVDVEDWQNSAVFSGDKSDINNYLVAQRKNPNTIPYNQSLYRGPHDEFRAWADANLNAGLEILNSIDKKDPENAFWAIQEANIKGKWAEWLEKYPSSHQRVAKDQATTVPDNYLDFRKELDLNNPDYMGSSTFTKWLAGVIKDKSKEENPELHRNELAMTYLHTAAQMLENTKVRDFIWVNLIRDELKTISLHRMEHCIEYLREEISNPQQLKRLNEIHSELKKFDNGQPALNFTAEDLDGNEVQFSDFAGKYVYIDVWATWCGPCIKEIPFLKELEKDYHGRNIVFISYSIDSNKQAWLDYIPENELGGVQIIGDNNWNSTLTKYYKVSAVPTFLFFNPDGKIIDVRMTRPSNPETRKVFDSYKDL